MTTPSLKLASALKSAGLTATNEADLHRDARAIARAIGRFRVRRLAAKSTPEKKVEWARSVEKHAKALAEVLSEGDATFRCDLEDQIVRIAREGTREILLPSENVSVLLDLAKAANWMRKDCDLAIRKRDAESKRPKNAGSAPLLPAIEGHGTGLTELIESIADAFEGLTGQAAHSKSVRGPHGPMKSGPFVEFVGRVCAAWAITPPSGSEIHLVLSWRPSGS